MNRMMSVNLLFACLLDGILGDPRWMPHPVRLMGAMISGLEGVGRQWFKRSIGQRWMGVMIAIVVPGVSAGMSWGVIHWASSVNEVLGNVVWTILAYTTLAAKDLAHHAMVVYQQLQSGALESARTAVSRIVGRDTDNLSEPEVIKATVETVAESTSDGVVAPLFYLILGGPPLALAYKAVNTLDSMIGHREMPYSDIGWASARLDDVMNWIPSRLCAGLLIVAAGLRLNTLHDAWRVYRRDGIKHASPNSGHPEAAMAGALGVQVGGPNTYDGVVVDRSRIGDPRTPLRLNHICMAITLMWWVFGLATLLGLSVTIFWSYL